MLFGLGPCLFLLGLPFAYSYPCACVLTDGVYLKSSEIYKPLTVGKCYRYSQDTTKPILKIQDYKTVGYVMDSPMINKTTCTEESNKSSRIVKRYWLCYSDTCRRCKCHPTEEHHCYHCVLCKYSHADCSKVPHSSTYNTANNIIHPVTGSYDCNSKHCRLCHCHPKSQTNCGTCSFCVLQFLTVNCASIPDPMAAATHHAAAKPTKIVTSTTTTTTKTTPTPTTTTKTTPTPTTTTTTPTSASTVKPTSISTTSKPTTTASTTTTVKPHWITLGFGTTYQPKWVTVKG